MLRVALLCEEAAGARVLERIIAGGHALAVLLTSAGSPASAAAARRGGPFSPAARVREPGFAVELARAEVDVLLNVHSLLIVPAEVLRAPRLGAFNLHPGLLPRFAGLNAPSWAIYHGEERHGVTLHRMAPGIDTGAIVYQASFPIRPEDTGLSLALRCIREGLPLIDRLLEGLSQDPFILPEEKQNLSQRRYFGRGVPRGSERAEGTGERVSG